jgi:hypothetical protein
MQVGTWPLLWREAIPIQVLAYTQLPRANCQSELTSCAAAKKKNNKKKKNANKNKDSSQPSNAALNKDEEEADEEPDTPTTAVSWSSLSASLTTLTDARSLSPL